MSETNPLPIADGVVPQGDGWVLFRCGEIWLAADQNQVRSISEARDYLPAEQPGRWVDPKRGWPAYLLDRRLNPMPGEKRRFAIFLQSIHGPVGILCDEIQALSAAGTGKPTPAPALIAAHSPVAKALLRPDPQRVAVVLDPVMLAMYLEPADPETETMAVRMEEELAP